MRNGGGLPGIREFFSYIRPRRLRPTDVGDHVPRAGGDVITITDWDEVAARMAAEGGTGRYEHLAEDTSIVDASMD